MHPRVHSNTAFNGQDTETTFESISRMKKTYFYAHAHTRTHTHDGLLLGHEKNEIMPFAALRMDLETLLLSEVSPTEEDKYHMVVTYIWS